VDSIRDRVGVDLLEKALVHDQQPKFNSLSNNGEDTISVSSGTGTEQEYRAGPVLLANPNMPRPPNWTVEPPNFFSIITTPAEEEQEGDGEVFVDANEQGSVGSQDSDMEVVVETISLS
jgi:hypothetical protein